MLSLVRLPRRGGRLVATVGVAIAAATGPASAAQSQSPTWFGYDDCTAAEIYLPAARDRVRPHVPDPFVAASRAEFDYAALAPLLSRVSDEVDIFVRAVRCRGDAGPVRSLWIGPLIHRASVTPDFNDPEAHEGQQVHLLWRLYTDDPGTWRRFHDAVPSDDIRLVPRGGALGVDFDELVDVPAPDGFEEPALFGGGLTDFAARLAGTRDDLRIEWTQPSPKPTQYLPELRGIRATWYARQDSRLYRIVSHFPQKGGGTVDDPPEGEPDVLNFRLGPATGVLHAASGTRLAEVLGGPATPGAEVESPAHSLFTHARGTRQNQCIEPVRDLTDSSSCLGFTRPSSG